jgi:hypothetical protein
LFFHHNWQTAEQKATATFADIKHHILLPWASTLQEADAAARSRLNPVVFEEILADVPDAWLAPDGSALAAAERRTAYVEFFVRRLNASTNFVEEAIRARAELV